MRIWLRPQCVRLLREVGVLVRPFLWLLRLKWIRLGRRE
jgi:hypothetical protein